MERAPTKSEHAASAHVSWRRELNYWRWHPSIHASIALAVAAASHRHLAAALCSVHCSAARHGTTRPPEHYPYRLTGSQAFVEHALPLPMRINPCRHAIARPAEPVPSRCGGARSRSRWPLALPVGLARGWPEDLPRVGGVPAAASTAADLRCHPRRAPTAATEYGWPTCLLKLSSGSGLGADRADQPSARCARVPTWQ